LKRQVPHFVVTGIIDLKGKPGAREDRDHVHRFQRVIRVAIMERLSAFEDHEQLIVLIMIVAREGGFAFGGERL